MGATWRIRLVHRISNETLQVSQSMHPQDNSGKNIRHSRFFPKINMPQMSCMDSTYHAAQHLVYALQNTEPASLLVKLGNVNKEALKTLTEVFRKLNPPAVPPRVTVREVGQKKFQ